MLKQIFATAIAFALTSSGVPAQSTATPSFDVVSIRQAEPITQESILAGRLRFGMRTDASRVEINFLSLKELIPMAYSVKPYQMVGPDWLSAQRFDIAATMPEGATKEQIPVMLQAMLADRFHLKAHRETKDQNIWALVVAKGGHKMQPAVVEQPAPPAAPGAKPEKADMVLGVGDNQMSINRTGNGAVVKSSTGGSMKVSMGAAGLMRMEFARMTMDEMATQLTPMLDKPVINMTELKGPFQVTLELTMADMLTAARAAGTIPAGLLPPTIPGGAGGAAGIPSASDPSGGSIINTVQQLGLRLESRKAPAETIVVDSVDKTPTEN